MDIKYQAEKPKNTGWLGVDGKWY